ncbi:hypothetical protein FQN54_001026 [Arachnomyces sp. PD_36]|nr:hypothetical protein FQN54_001026 [Arachnomyces sp. PD_36]
MKFPTSSFLAALSASAVLSAPLEKKQAVTDLDVLQFALTLEHLENVFYKGALSRFTEADFLAAGFTSQYFNNLQFIVSDEEAHVVFLQDAISAAGGTPVAACEYNFPYNDIHSFVALGSVLEGVGVAAYLGGAAVISSKDILASAGAILVAEGLHQSVQRTSLHQVASANIAGTAITANSIFTVASAFIASCPPSNPVLPFQAFSSLVPTQANPNSIQTLTTFTIGQGVIIPPTFFVTFISGLDVISVPGTHQGGVVSATIPVIAQGQTYAFVTNTDISGAFVESAVLAGPAILEVTPSAPTFDLTLL